MKVTKSCYKSNLYLKDEMDNLSFLFENSDDFGVKLYGKKLSRRKVLEKFMSSEIRSYMEIGHPRYCRQASIDTLEAYVNLELKGDYSSLLPYEDEVDNFACMELLWIGMMYAYIHYRTKIISADIIKILDLDAMRHFYVCGHEMGIKAAYNHLKAAFEEYL